MRKCRARFPLTISVFAILAAAGAAFSQAGTTRPSTSATKSAAPVSPAAATKAAPDNPLANAADYLDRASHLKEDDVDGRLALARWTFNHQMYSQAVEMVNQALYLEPQNRAAYTILQQVDDARPLAEEPQTAAALKKEMEDGFKHEFKIKYTRHFMICYDTTDVFAAQRGTYLEKSYDAFHFFFNMKTLHPEFLSGHLKVILFKSRDDYLTYGKEVEKNDFSWAVGFYAQGRNRSVFYDESSGVTGSSYDKQAAKLKAQLEDYNKQLATARQLNQNGLVATLNVEITRTNNALTQLSFQRGNQVQAQNNATTMHEASHQISFNSGIQTRAVDYPFWLSEGLACSFEVEDASGHRGPAILNFGRIGTLKQALRENRLNSIEAVVSAASPSVEDEKGLTLAYAESWAVFHYLYKFQRQGMEDFLLAYRSHRPFVRIGAEEKKAIFVKAFGDNFEDLNKKYTAYIKSLPSRPG
jgi:hypothetical protein